AQATNDLRMLCLAMNSYHAEHQAYPTTFTPLLPFLQGDTRLANGIGPNYRYGLQLIENADHFVVDFKIIARPDPLGRPGIRYLCVMKDCMVVDCTTAEQGQAAMMAQAEAEKANLKAAAAAVSMLMDLDPTLFKQILPFLQSPDN